MNKEQFRFQAGGVVGLKALEAETPTCNSFEWIPAPAVVLSEEQHEEREHRLKANYQQPWKRECYPAPPCVLAIKEQEDGA